MAFEGKQAKLTTAAEHTANLIVFKMSLVRPLEDLDNRLLIKQMIAVVDFFKREELPPHKVHLAAKLSAYLDQLYGNNNGKKVNRAELLRSIEDMIQYLKERYFNVSYIDYEPSISDNVHGNDFDGEVLTLSEFEAFLREKDTYKLLPERLNAHQGNVLAYYWLMHCAFFDNVRYTSIYLRCRSHLKGLDEMLDEADPFEIVVKDLTQKAFGL